MIEKRYRNIRMQVRVTEEERDLIHVKMAQLGTCNIEAYLRKMAIDGYVIDLDLTEVKELVRLLRITSNSLNQIAKRANTSGNLYKKDIDTLIESYDKLWTLAEDVMVSLCEIK